MPHERISGSLLPCARTHTKRAPRSAEYYLCRGELTKYKRSATDKGARVRDGGGWLTLEWPFGVSCSYARQLRTARSRCAPLDSRRVTNVTDDRSQARYNNRKLVDSEVCVR